MRNFRLPKLILLTILLPLLIACAQSPPTTIEPQVVFMTATPQVVRVTATPAPTSATPTPGEPTVIPLTNLQKISPNNATAIALLRSFTVPDFRSMRETCGVDFSSDGRYFAAACMSSSIPIWDTQTGELVRTFQGNRIWAGLAFSPDSQTLASDGIGDTIALWDVATGESAGRLEGAPSNMNVIAYSSDGTRLAAGSFNGVATVWDIFTGEILTTFDGHDSRINSVAFSPDGSRVVSGGGDNLARVWDAETGEEYLILDGPTYFVEDVEYSPDGRHILGAADDNTVRIWDAETGELIDTLYGHRGPVNGIAYHPEGTLFASTSNDRDPRLWNAATGEHLATLDGHDNYAIRPAFSPNGTLLATVGWDGVVLLYGIPAGQTPAAQAPVEPDLTFAAPLGEPPLIDGNLSPGEWDDAEVLEISSGELLLKTDGDYLYIGLRSEVLGVGSPCVYLDEEIDVLHSSAALGTATYVQSSDGTWERARTFEWTNRETDQSEAALAARQAHLDEENWLASNMLTGDPNAMEYQIALQDGVVKLAVTYLEGPDFNSAAVWPPQLADGCQNISLMQGEPPTTLTFEPDTWMTVIAGNP